MPKSWKSAQKSAVSVGFCIFCLSQLSAIPIHHKMHPKLPFWGHLGLTVYTTCYFGTWHCGYNYYSLTILIDSNPVSIRYYSPCLMLGISQRLTWRADRTMEGVCMCVSNTPHAVVVYYYYNGWRWDYNSEDLETESLQYVSRFLRQDSLIFTQNLADVSHVQYLLLKCPNLAPWDKPMIFTTLSHYLIKTWTKTSYNNI